MVLTLNRIYIYCFQMCNRLLELMKNGDAFLPWVCLNSPPSSQNAFQYTPRAWQAIATPSLTIWPPWSVFVAYSTAQTRFLSAVDPSRSHPYDEYILIIVRKMISPEIEDPKTLSSAVSLAYLARRGLYLYAARTNIRGTFFASLFFQGSLSSNLSR